MTVPVTNLPTEINGFAGNEKLRPVFILFSKFILGFIPVIHLWSWKKIFI